MQLEAAAYGVLLATLAFPAVAVARLRREPAFFSALLIAIAAFYPVFAVDAGLAALALQGGVAVCFAALAIVGYAARLWLIPAGFVLHGIYDALIAAPGPSWWGAFCFGVDLPLAAFAACAARSQPR